jgi:hypothetical protein
LNLHKSVYLAMLSQLHGLYGSIKHVMTVNSEKGKMCSPLQELRKIRRNHPVQYPGYKAGVQTAEPRPVDLPCKSV